MSFAWEVGQVKGIRGWKLVLYGGAGVHVDYLSRELDREIEVEVHCWGPQHSDQGNLHVRGAEPWAEISNGTEGKFKGALEAFSLNLTQVKALSDIDVVHTHTWYVSMAGFLAKKLYSVPFVLTTHSLEPLRAWKAEQLGSGYAMGCWMERTAILDAAQSSDLARRPECPACSAPHPLPEEAGIQHLCGRVGLPILRTMSFIMRTLEGCSPFAGTQNSQR